MNGLNEGVQKETAVTNLIKADDILIKYATSLGARVGVWTAVLFIVTLFLLFSLIALMDGPPYDYFQSVFSGGAVAISFFLIFGMAPAALIGALSGRVAAFTSLRIQKNSSTFLSSIILGVAVSLFVALPLISIVPSLVIAIFIDSDVSLPWFRVSILAFTPFCIVAGINFGRQIYQECLPDESILKEKTLVVDD